MALLGWYAKQRMKYLVVFLLISLLFYLAFMRQWEPYDTPFCFKDKCIVPPAYGKNSRGGNCFGNKCKAGSCVGENCRGGDCSGFNCKAGDCYGLNCTPGRCNDPTCKKKTDKDKTSPTYGQEIGCTQGKCGDGRAYDIVRGPLHKFTKNLPENTTLNKQYCDTVKAASQIKKSGTKESSIWKKEMKIPVVRYYHKGWQKTSYTKPKRKEGEPIIVQLDPIMDTKPSIYKGDNCQWCTNQGIRSIGGGEYDTYDLGKEVCSNFKPKREEEKTGPDKDIIKDKWTWEPGEIYECFPRDQSGLVIDCDMHPTSDGRVTWQHQMVQVDYNTFRCKICNRTCSKK